MKKLLTIIAIFMTVAVSAQTYVSASTSFYNGAYNFGQRGMVTVEVGKTWDVLSVGLAGGVTQFEDGTGYLEVRPAVTVFQKGIVNVDVNLGAGYVFNTDLFLTEYGLTGGITINKSWKFSVFAGSYHFNGKYSYSKSSFTGLGFTYVFK